MPGDAWQKFASLRLLFTFLFAYPGKKLLFQGSEFGQEREWNFAAELDWHLLEQAPHQGLQRLVADLNRLYRGQRALHDLDFDHAGFEWIDCHDSSQSVLSFLRQDRGQESVVVAVFNFTPVPRHGYRIGVPRAGFYREALNSDAECYGGSNLGNSGGVNAEAFGWMGRSGSLRIDLPPLAGLVLVHDRDPDTTAEADARDDALDADAQ